MPLLWMPGKLSLPSGRFMVRMGRSARARRWLGQALELGGKEMKSRALDDPVLAGAWW